MDSIDVEVSTYQDERGKGVKRAWPILDEQTVGVLPEWVFIDSKRLSQ
jgi:hypothetical protein